LLHNNQSLYLNTIQFNSLNVIVSQVNLLGIYGYFQLQDNLSVSYILQKPSFLVGSNYSIVCPQKTKGFPKRKVFCFCGSRSGLQSRTTVARQGRGNFVLTKTKLSLTTNESVRFEIPVGSTTCQSGNIHHLDNYFWCCRVKLVVPSKLVHQSVWHLEQNHFCLACSTD